MVVNTLLNVAILSVIEVFAQVRLYAFTKSGNGADFFQGFIAYIGVILMFIFTLRGSNLLYTKVLWDGISGILQAGVAFFILGDRLNNTQEYMGILCILFGVVILQSA